MGPLWAIAMKDVRLLLRDRAGFFFTFVFPLIVAVFFGMIFASGSTPGELPLAVVDLDRTGGSRAFLRQLEEGGDFDVSTIAYAADAAARDGRRDVSVEPSVVPDPGLSREAAIEAVRSGSVSACLIILPGFGAAREAPFAGARMGVELAIDPSRKASGGMIEGLLTKYGFQQLSAGFAEPEKMRAQAKRSLDMLRLAGNLHPERRAEFETFFGNLDKTLASVPAGGGDTGGAGASDRDGPGAGRPAGGPATAFSPLEITKIPVVRARPGPQNPFEITFPQGVIWGISGCALGFSISLVTERTRGTMMRLRCAPLSAWQILGGKGLACFMVTLCVSTLILTIGILVFKVRPTSYPKLALAVASAAACFVGVMMLLATFSGSERGGSGLGWGVLMVLSMIGGGMIPLEFLPTWLQPVSNISPIKWSILAIEGGLWRGLSLEQMLLPLGVLLGIGAAGFGVGMMVLGDAERA